MYYRKRTRPARAVEIAGALLKVKSLETKLSDLELQLQAARFRATAAETFADRLLQDKLALVNELRQARTIINFLQGFEPMSPYVQRRIF